MGCKSSAWHHVHRHSHTLTPMGNSCYPIQSIPIACFREVGWNWSPWKKPIRRWGQLLSSYFIYAYCDNIFLVDQEGSHAILHTGKKMKTQFFRALGNKKWSESGQGIYFSCSTMTEFFLFTEMKSWLLIFSFFNFYFFLSLIVFVQILTRDILLSAPRVNMPAVRQQCYPLHHCVAQQSFIKYN